MRKGLVILGVMVIGATLALAAELSVPFFRDTPTVAGFIGIKNSLNQDQTITITYTQVEDGTPVPQAGATHLLGALAQLSWRPVQDDAGEGAGQAVPNTSPTNGATNIFAGSATIQSNTAGSLSGRYVEVTGTGPFSYLIPTIS